MHTLAEARPEKSIELSSLPREADAQHGTRPRPSLHLAPLLIAPAVDLPGR